MTDVTQIKVGFVANLGGGQNKLGTGILSSAIFGFDRYCQDRPFGRETIVLEEGDDHGQAATALECAQKFFDEGAVAVIGPADSHGAELVLSKAEFGLFPFIITFATATRLASYGTNMFRTTNNDSTRADELISFIRKNSSKGSRVSHLSLVSPDGSYAHGLKTDVENALRKAGMASETIPFSQDQEINGKHVGEGPIVISAPSLQAAEVVRKLRATSYRGPIFAFGSNSNFLKPYCSGMIVISDLDRASDKASIRRELARYKQLNPNETEPSLATMNGAYALADAIAKSGLDPSDIVLINREKLHQTLMSADLEGMFGPIRFLERNGELIGVEYIDKLQVSASNRDPEFSSKIEYSRNRSHSVPEKAKLYFHERPILQKGWRWVAAGIGLTAALVTLATSAPALLGGG